MKKNKKHIKKKNKKSSHNHGWYGISTTSYCKLDLIAAINLSTDEGDKITSQLYSDDNGQYYLSLDGLGGQITVPEDSELYRDYFESPLGEEMNKLIALHQKEGRIPVLTITREKIPE